MLWPTTTTRSTPASARTASTARAKFSMLNLPFAGAALLPCPGRSSVITRYFALKAGTCALHDDSSQVQPCTKITACEPLPVDVQCTLAPSTLAADAARANASAPSAIKKRALVELIEFPCSDASDEEF